MLDLNIISRQLEEASPHTRALGIRLHELKRGFGVVVLDPRDTHIGLPDNGAVHGGILSTLIDTACGMTVLSVLSEPTSIATLDLTLHHIKPSAPGTPLYASAECCKVTSSIVFLRSIVYQNSPENLIAHGSTTFMLGANHTNLYLDRQKESQ